MMSAPIPLALQEIIDAVQREPNEDGQRLKRLLEQASISEKTLADYSDFAHPAELSYGRKSVWTSDRFGLYVMSWNPGDFTAIHGHGHAEWGAVLCLGETTHRTYSVSGNSLRLAQAEVFAPGTVLGSCSAEFYHAMGNLSSTRFLTLHVYGSETHRGPATEGARIFDLGHNRIRISRGPAFLELPAETVINDVPGLITDAATREDFLRCTALYRLRQAKPVEHPLGAYLPKVEKSITAILERERTKAPFDNIPGSTLSETLGRTSLDEGLTLDETWRALDEALKGTPSTSHPQFLNQLFGGRVSVAVAAEMLMPVVNSSLYTMKAAGAQVLVENQVLSWMLAKAGWQGEGAFVPGGSAANLVAMALARHERYPDFRDNGPQGEPLIAYTSAEGHYSIRKNAGLLGLGRNHVRPIRVDHQGALDLHELEETIRRDLTCGLRPFFLNATAGTTVRGAFDPLEALGSLAKKYGLWFHVDGALGASLLMSPQHRHRLDGLSMADSLTWNPHKMMGVPLQASVLLTSQRGRLQGCLDESADYLFQTDTPELNPGHRSLQCGRRNDAFKLWAAWLSLGDIGWARRVDRQMDLAVLAAQLIVHDPELELAELPPSINVCFRVMGKESAAICEHLNREGTLKIGYGDVGGQESIRLVTVNPDLDEVQLRQILGEIKRAAAVV